MIAGRQQLACLLWSDTPGAGIKSFHSKVSLVVAKRIRLVRERRVIASVTVTSRRAANETHLHT
jgi:hypothetical protein